MMTAVKNSFLKIQSMNKARSSKIKKRQSVKIQLKSQEYLLALKCLKMTKRWRMRAPILRFSGDFHKINKSTRNLISEKATQ
jgi:hypothetical protein